MNKKIVLGLMLFSVITTIYAKNTSNSEEQLIHYNNFMGIANFVYRGKNSIDPSAILPGNVIFLAGDQGANDFFREIHPKIKHPYIVVYFSGGLYGLILDDPKILHFFCAGGDGPLKNNHPKYSYIPIGFFRGYNRINTITAEVNKLRNRRKTKLAYMNFTKANHMPWRNECYDFFQHKSFTTKALRKDFLDYIGDLSDHKFIISPPGDVLDCYRHWEALALGSIPIMQHSQIDSLFDGLPVLFIDDWSQVAEGFLNKKYREISSKKYSFEKLYMQYWIDQINQVKNNYRPELKRKSLWKRLRSVFSRKKLVSV